ncbi:hypothetical protein, partial [Methylobacterium crusticola]|uniref:hypothetical protein n=1 Tax=Methylobacterium crusticola TaxID=1697972 RepID=UPI001EE2CE0F
PRTRALALGGAVIVLSLVAAACGGGDNGSGTVQTDAGGSEAVVAEPAASDFMSTRPGAGIAAAGGNPQAVSGDNPCEQTG